jgi:hypothetical protein
MVRPEGFEPPVPAFGGLCVIQLRYGRTQQLVLALSGWSCARHVLEQIQLVVDQRAVEFPHAVGMPEEVRARVREIVSGAIGNVVRNLDLFHLRPVDRVGAEIARDS